MGINCSTTYSAMPSESIIIFIGKKWFELFQSLNNLHVLGIVDNEVRHQKPKEWAFCIYDDRQPYLTPFPVLHTHGR